MVRKLDLAELRLVRATIPRLRIQSIACEISVTTPAEHELANVQKCLAADFEQVSSSHPAKCSLKPEQ